MQHPSSDSQNKEYLQANKDYSEWIQQIWLEKRGRPVTDGEEEYTFALGLKEPTFDVSVVVDGVIKGLRSVEPQFAYEWSKRWGQARIALSPTGEPHWKFVNIRSNESKKFSPVFTEMKLPPSEMMFDSRSETGVSDATVLVINDSEPVTMEGAVLQIERMVDELIWSTSYEIETTQGISQPRAYQIALEQVESSGVIVRYASTDTILNLKRQNPSDWVRLYGDVHKQSTIPQVIGIVCKSSETDEGVIKRTPPTLRESSQREEADEKSSNVDNETEPPVTDRYTFATSFTAGKRPHIGHLFLLSRIQAAAHSIKEPIDVMIEINDTGERFEALIEIARKETGLPPQDIIDGINDGTFNLEQVEQWYTQRSAADKKSMYYVPPKSPSLSMTNQLEEIIGSVQPVFGSVPLRGVLSSSLNYDRVLRSSEPAWIGTGYEVHKGRVLRKRGGPTPFLTRLGFIDAIADTNNGIVYVDSSTEIADAVRISKDSLENEMHCIPGAGVGFDFSIHSGSRAVSEFTIDSVLEWYAEHATPDSTQLVADINFMTTRLPMHKPVDHAESYYNFKDISSFQELLIKSRQDRWKLVGILEDIRSIMPTSTVNQFVDGVPRAMKSEVGKIIGTYARQDAAHHQDTTRIRTFTPVHAEHPGLLKLIHADPELADIKDQTQKIYHYLKKNLNQVDCTESVTLNALRAEGYVTDDEQLGALTNLIERHHALKLQLSPSQLMVNNVLKVLESVTSIAEADCEDFYALCSATLACLKDEK